MENTQHRWHLLGAGSLGCLFAAYLRRAGIAIELIVRNDNTLQQFNENDGITLTRHGKAANITVDVTTPISAQAPITHLLICTKAHQTLSAIKTIKTKISADATIVLLQNGMGVRELIQTELPEATVLHALSTEGAFREARFHVTHAGRGETLIGAVDPQQQDRARQVTQSLQCELKIAFAPDISRRLWLKLAVNSVINPLTALHRCRNGELSQLDHIDATVAQLCTELARIAAAEHIDLNATQMIDEVYRVIRATAHNKSSMLQDVEAKRATEIDFINGFIVQRARIHGLPCAQHQHLLQEIDGLSPAKPADWKVS